MRGDMVPKNTKLSVLQWGISMPAAEREQDRIKLFWTMCSQPPYSNNIGDGHATPQQASGEEKRKVWRDKT